MSRQFNAYDSRLVGAHSHSNHHHSGAPPPSVQPSRMSLNNPSLYNLHENLSLDADKVPVLKNVVPALSLTFISDSVQTLTFLKDSMEKDRMLDSEKRMKSKEAMYDEPDKFENRVEDLDDDDGPGGGGNGQAEDESGAFQCPLCYHTSSPVTKQRIYAHLPCSHSFCFECVLKLIFFAPPPTQESESNVLTKCPLCLGEVTSKIIFSFNSDTEFCEKTLRRCTPFALIPYFVLENRQIARYLDRLTTFKCKHCSFSLSMGGSMRAGGGETELTILFKQFNHHLLNNHSMLCCTICFQNTQRFPCELRSYSYLKEFKDHLFKPFRIGGVRARHYFCSLCPEAKFYFDHAALENHCNLEHRLCSICVYGTHRTFYGQNIHLNQHNVTNHLVCRICYHLSARQQNESGASTLFTMAFTDEQALLEHGAQDHGGEENSVNNLMLQPNALMFVDPNTNSLHQASVAAMLKLYDKPCRDARNFNLKQFMNINIGLEDQYVSLRNFDRSSHSSKRATFDEIDNILRKNFQEKLQLEGPAVFHTNVESYITHFPGIASSEMGGGVGFKKPSMPLFTASSAAQSQPFEHSFPSLPSTSSQGASKSGPPRIKFPPLTQKFLGKSEAKSVSVSAKARPSVPSYTTYSDLANRPRSLGEELRREGDPSLREGKSLATKSKKANRVGGAAVAHSVAGSSTQSAIEAAISDVMGSSSTSAGLPLPSHVELVSAEELRALKAARQLNVQQPTTTKRKSIANRHDDEIAEEFPSLPVTAQLAPSGWPVKPSNTSSLTLKSKKNQRKQQQPKQPAPAPQLGSEPNGGLGFFTEPPLVSSTSGDVPATPSFGISVNVPSRKTIWEAKHKPFSTLDKMSSSNEIGTGQNNKKRNKNPNKIKLNSSDFLGNAVSSSSSLLGSSSNGLASNNNNTATTKSNGNLSAPKSVNQQQNNNSVSSSSQPSAPRFLVPTNQQERKAEFLSKLKQCYGNEHNRSMSKETLQRFSQLMVDFKSGFLPVDEYYQQTLKLLGTRTFDAIIPYIIVNIPDIPLQKTLFAHNQSVWNNPRESASLLLACPSCGQLVLKQDKRMHIDLHKQATTATSASASLANGTRG